ncbi:unnamed protein product [Didymodactylos carnosus]|uniref:DUF218 domain-containing protein n=1 Tax=Didymodactylos carnosus TaxID=1234261 RepID=A0A813VQV2_9BILA|nr:unnamed protein product [Didymodactylos carnosus]CAF0846813.1 unnamed protein product [Didymodactylos carnosus]CAF3628638.1 unnamed protein product [Didymodactylos carnosus]CAF3634470.1 unnamed protein product [Didymodactylos carnosus]
MTEYDCVIIPGGGLNEFGEPSKWVQARLDRAIELDNQTNYFLVLSRGTTHRPPLLDNLKYPIDEATAGANYLMSHKIKKEKILIENWSLDTIGNAYFSLVCICEPMQLKRLCIITNEFHIERTKLIFDWLYHMIHESIYHLTYLTVENQGMTDEQLVVRVQKEKISCQDLKEKIIKLTTRSDVAKFLFLDHAAYAANVLHTKKSDIDELTASTY